MNKMIHSDIFLYPHTNTVAAAGVNIASRMNDQHFNSEVDWVSVAVNKIAFVRVFGKSREQTFQGRLLHQQKCSTEERSKRQNTGMQPADTDKKTEV